MTISARFIGPTWIQDFQIGKIYHGFLLENIVEIEGIRAIGLLFRHQKSGARLYKVANDDRNNLFSIAFRTPPPDDTGLPHILEHSVLGGSRKFKVKDPFNEMAKGSMATFINAMTYPDKTVYPVSSQIPKDFYNLMDVYLDAVLFPNLSELTFAQEGHHLENEDIGDTSTPLTIKGIVYNEMKGAYGTLEAIASEKSFRALFPDTPYGRDSGGNPEAIPGLTYEQFRDFHRRYYHPTNSRIILVGDLPLDGLLLHIDENYLRLFNEDASTIPEIIHQPRWSESRRRIFDVPAVSEENADEFCLTINWLTADALNTIEVTALHLIEELILGNAAAPLRRALIDSGLGTDLAPGSGFGTGTLQTYFSVGLRGIVEADLPKVEKLIETTIREIIERGFSDEDIARAFHQLEFHTTEIKGGNSPHALSIMGTILDSWLYDGPPDLYLDWRPYLQRARQILVSKPDHLVSEMRRYFIENNHKIVLTFRPSATYVAEKEQRLASELSAKQASLSSDEKEKIAEFAGKLMLEQERANSSEDLASLPSITIADIQREVDRIPLIDDGDIRGIRVLRNDLFTNGIFYLDLFFDMSNVRHEYLQYLPLLAIALDGHGIDSRQYSKKNGEPVPEIRQGYDAFANRKSLFTGSLGAQESTVTRLHSENNLVYGVSVGSKALGHNVVPMLEILRDLLLYVDLEDSKRFTDLITQEKAGMLASIAPSGVRYAWTLGSARYSQSGFLKEKWSGFHYLKFLDAVLAGDISETLAKMKLLKKEMLENSRVYVHITCAESDYQTHSKQLREKLLAPLADGVVAKSPLPIPNGDFFAEYNRDWALPITGVPGVRYYQAIAVQSPVSYATLVFPVADFSSPEGPYLYFLQNFLSSGFLNERIRIQGGAYGGFSSYFSMEGQMAFGSYRDPSPGRSVNVFEECIKFIRRADFAADEIQRSLIGSFSGLDKPQSPAARGASSFQRFISGLTDEDRQKFRDILRDLRPENLFTHLEKGIPANQTGVVTILGPENSITEWAEKEGIRDLKIFRV